MRQELILVNLAVEAYLFVGLAYQNSRPLVRLWYIGHRIIVGDTLVVLLRIDVESETATLFRNRLSQQGALLSNTTSEYHCVQLALEFDVVVAYISRYPINDDIEGKLVIFCRWILNCYLRKVRGTC